MSKSDHVYISSCSIKTGTVPSVAFRIHICMQSGLKCVWNTTDTGQTNAGDDCVSILSDTSDVNITDIKCGPGHGIRYKCTTISMQACADQVPTDKYLS
jgi:hypothetical protein